MFAPRSSGRVTTPWSSRLANDNIHTDPVVSSDRDELILVDPSDQELGYLSKERCHDGDGVLHRAFSLFVLDRAGRVLMQQRAGDKRLWPGYWSNACCSHPRRGEDTAEAVRRRAAEELGIHIDAPEYLYKFEYHARFDASGSEHELCHVYVARIEQDPRPNRNEIDAWAWYDPQDLDAMLAQEDETLTPWFRLEWQRLRREYADRLSPVAQTPTPHSSARSDRGGPQTD